MAQVDLVFADGDRLTLQADPGESILSAARRYKLILASDCEVGDCQTCRATLVAGAVAYDTFGSISLSPAEQEDGAVLLCVASPSEDVTVGLPYGRGALLPAKTVRLTVTAVDRLGDRVIRLRGKVGSLTPFVFFPGQYVNIRVPGTDETRAYSMASAPEHPDEVAFLIGLVDGGLMSRCVTGLSVGDRLEMRGPFGTFYLREGADRRSLLLVAGGTGLAPMLAMLHSLAARSLTDRPVTLCLGVNTPDDLAMIEDLPQLAARFPAFDLRLAVRFGPSSDRWRTGLVTDLLDDVSLVQADIYLCGPPPMIEASTRILHARGADRDRIYAEQFTPSGVAEPAL